MMKLGFSFGNDFIDQRVLVVSNSILHETFQDYLNTRTLAELRELERKMEEGLDKEWALRFDDYTQLCLRDGRVYTRVWFPGDEEPQDDDLSAEEFFELIVRFNYEYDLILIRKENRTISPEARAVIKRIYGEEYEG